MNLPAGTTTWTKEAVFDPDAVPFLMCHASTLAEVSPGCWAAAWFGGSREGAADTAIWLARRSEAGWTEPERVVRVRDEAHWNPVLFHDDTSGETLLFFKVGMHIPSWETWAMRSRDGGATWSGPGELVPGDRGGRGPCKNKPLRLAGGDWLAPASLENGEWRAFVDRSGDAGRTWQASPLIPLDNDRLAAYQAGRAADLMPAEKPTRMGVIQPALWESEPGYVHMLLRSSFGRICRSDSEDGGRTWRAVYPTELPNNNSGIDLVRLPDGRLLLACNPVGENWGVRTPLVVLVSDDNGATWGRAAVLENEPERPGQKPEFSYPSIVCGSTGPAMVYTRKRREIVFAEACVE